ncbi:MAG: response regulator [Burkholderiales bacterium]
MTTPRADASASPARVLVVDDNAINIDLVRFVLQADGLVVDAAADAAAALQLIEQACPDAILMDIQMPGMDGLEFTRLLKADPRRRHITIIAFTAYAMKGDEQKMRDAGCDGYISKPIDVKTFAADVRSFLPARSAD